MTLLTAVLRWIWIEIGRVCCRHAVQQSIDIARMQSPQQQTHHIQQLRSKMGQTDRWTDTASLYRRCNSNSYKQIRHGNGVEHC